MIMWRWVRVIFSWILQCLRISGKMQKGSVDMQPFLVLGGSSMVFLTSEKKQNVQALVMMMRLLTLSIMPYFSKMGRFLSKQQTSPMAIREILWLNLMNLSMFTTKLVLLGSPRILQMHVRSYVQCSLSLGSSIFLHRSIIFSNPGLGGYSILTCPFTNLLTVIGQLSLGFTPGWGLSGCLPSLMRGWSPSYRISNKMMPRDHMSENLPPTSSRIIQGAAQRVVPAPLPMDMAMRDTLSRLSTNLAHPKSQIKYSPSALTKMLSGLRSKCQQPACLSNERNAIVIWQRKHRISVGVCIFLFLRQSDREPLRQNGMTRIQHSDS